MSYVGHPDDLWRSRATPTALWFAIVISFAWFYLVGLLVVGAVLAGLQLIGVDVNPYAVWVVLVVALLPFTLRGNRPADHGAESEQSWTEYTVRAVMVGETRPRSIWWRLGCDWAFGPGVVGYGVVFIIQRALGLID